MDNGKRVEQLLSVADVCVSRGMAANQTEGQMQAVPTHEALVASLDRLFLLETADGSHVEARLIAAPIGVAMDACYISYSATFELPAGILLPQDTYRIRSPDGETWELLATPTRPSANGRGNLTVVLHYLRPDYAAQHSLAET